MYPKIQNTPVGAAVGNKETEVLGVENFRVVSVEVGLKVDVEVGEKVVCAEVGIEVSFEVGEVVDDIG